MDQESSPHVGLTELSVPLEGVTGILSGWSGTGSFYEALAAVSGDEDLERDWDEKAIRARAERILIEHVRAGLEKWPRTVEEWLPHLPVSSRSEVISSSTPRGRVMWRDTALRSGWPPRSYVTRRRHREITDVTVTTLAWTVKRLDEIIARTFPGSVVDEDDPTFSVPLEAARKALRLTETPEAPPRPDRHELEALKTSGRPWSYIQPVAGMIVRSETDLHWFAEQLLAPDPEMRWRLFHLAALGHLLQALRRQQARISWRAPLGAGSSGPHFVATLPDGIKVDVWFEAAGAHQFYSGASSSLYSQTVKPVRGADRSIGADLALYVPSRNDALLLEVKFSWSATYISRNGFHQAAAYIANAGSRWNRVWSYVLGPVERVSGTSRERMSRTHLEDVLGVTSIAGLEQLVGDFLGSQAEADDERTRGPEVSSFTFRSSQTS